VTDAAPGRKRWVEAMMKRYVLRASDDGAQHAVRAPRVQPEQRRPTGGSYCNVAGCGVLGYPSNSGSFWTDGATGNCSEAHALICLEQRDTDRSDSFFNPPPTRRVRPCMGWFNSIANSVGSAVNQVVSDVGDAASSVATAAEHGATQAVSDTAAVARAVEQPIADVFDRTIGKTEAGKLLSAMADVVVKGGVSVLDDLAAAMRPKDKAKDDQTPADNPALTQDEQKNYRYQTHDNGELMPADGPCADDVQQTQIGDCYFLSNLAGLAQKDPQAVKDMIKDNGDGTYSVRFFKNEGGKLVPEWIKVDGALPTDANGKLLSAQAPIDPATGKEVLWPAIVEKAFIVFNAEQHVGGDGQADYGTSDFGAGISSGCASLAYEALTGQPAADKPTAPMSDDELFDELSRANDGQVVTASSYPLTDEGVTNMHVYTVLGTEECDGQRYVILRNPWGNDPLDNGNNGVIRIPLAEFKREYEAVTTQDDSPAAHAESDLESMMEQLRAFVRC
jgi:hypothetical protein